MRRRQPLRNVFAHFVHVHDGIASGLTQEPTCLEGQYMTLGPPSTDAGMHQTVLKVDFTSDKGLYDRPYGTQLGGTSSRKVPSNGAFCGSDTRAAFEREIRKARRQF